MNKGRIRHVLLTALSVFAVGARLSAAEPRPNFLLIVADDLCWRDLGCTGNVDVKTPHIDRLASEGVHMRGMFSPATSCSPTRHALYTGLFPIRSGAYPNHARVDESTRSVFTHLKAMGYRVALQGKTHVSPPPSFPFEHLSSNPDNVAVFTKFIRRDPAQPWLAVLASNDPHVPWTRGPAKAYDPKKLTIPPYLNGDALTRANLAAYYAEISQLDTQVGAWLQALEESGQKETTLVLFVSEQGSSFPYGGKQTVYDNGIRSAAFLRWPGKVAAGTSSDALMQYVDVAPTFIAVAGGDPDAIDTGCPNRAGGSGFDGRSFLGALVGGAEIFRDVIYAQHTTVGLNGYTKPYPCRAVRDSRYKLIRNLAPQNAFVFDRIDPDQGGNLPWRYGVMLDAWRSATRSSALVAR